MYFIPSILGIAVLLHTSSGKSSQMILCRDPKSLAFVGLAIDENSYKSVKGTPDEDGTRQEWILTKEGSKETSPINSFGGSFLQCLPDNGRRYPRQGISLREEAQLHVSPYVSFRLRVEKEGEGLHTLFLRWTGGDDFGGGDSLYVSLLDRKGGVMYGEHTLKPAMVPIASGKTGFAGCCYEMTTHACPCFTEKPDNITCPYFQTAEAASKFGAQCAVGNGVMEVIRNPQWYLFAGQEAGDIMDFNSERWDATCEAEGSNTADSGRDFAMWSLKKGDYELRVYAREDGTALDGFYFAGPNAEAPGAFLTYDQGSSTFCERQGSGGVVVAVFLVAFFLLGGLAVGKFGVMGDVGAMLARFKAVSQSYSEQSAGMEIVDNTELQLGSNTNDENFTLA